MRTIEFTAANAGLYPYLMQAHIGGSNHIMTTAEPRRGKPTDADAAERLERGRLFRKLKAIGIETVRNESPPCRECGRPFDLPIVKAWTIKLDAAGLARIVLEPSEWQRLKEHVVAMPWGAGFDDIGADVIDLVYNAADVPAEQSNL